MRDQIVKKLNSTDSFDLNQDEMEYILRNWIQMHSQHHAHTIITYDYGKGIWTEVKLDKDSIYKL
jgi:hypothetical protein